jgi:hypothetical protein
MTAAQCNGHVGGFHVPEIVCSRRTLGDASWTVIGMTTLGSNGVLLVVFTGIDICDLV